MMRVIALITLVWLAFCGQAAAFGMGGGSQATSCPQLIYTDPSPVYPIHNDGCGQSPNGNGFYTRSNFAVYAVQSGQTWTAPHPQPHNMAGVDYGVGPTALVSTMADISHFGDGTVAGTNCGQASGTTCGCTYYDGTVGHQWTSGAPASWDVTLPALGCTGNVTAPEIFANWNFGPTAFQGSPNGSHDCVNLVFNPNSGALSTSPVTVKNNAFINGATCAHNTAITYGQFTSVKSGMFAKFIVFNNYIDGRNQNACCISGTNAAGTSISGIWFSLSAGQDDVDIEYNWITNTPLVAVLLSPSSGNETANCNNGTSYGLGNPGYNIILAHNYIEGIGYSFGSGHWEVATINPQAAATICQEAFTFNTVVWDSTSAAEGTTTFYGNANAANQGVIQYLAVDHNTIATNLTGGKQLPYVYNYYDWHTNGNAINEIVIDGAGSSCGANYPGTSTPIVCAFTSASVNGVVPGAFINGGTNNLNGSTQNTIGTQAFDVATAAFGGGCNQQQAAGGTLCPNNSPYSSLAVNTPSVAASGGPFTGTTITLAATCPTLLAGSTVIDNTQSGAAVGTVSSCSGTTLTLQASSAISVANSDVLQVGIPWPFSYNAAAKVLNSQFDFRVLSAAGAETGYGSVTVYAPVVSTSSGTTITLTTNCVPTYAGLPVYDTTNSGQLVGTIASCPKGAAVVNLTASPLVTVTNGDTLSIPTYGFGQIAYTNNALDGTGSNANASNANPYYWALSPSITGTGYLGTGAGGCATAALVQGNYELRTGSYTPTVNSAIPRTNSGC